MALVRKPAAEGIGEFQVMFRMSIDRPSFDNLLRMVDVTLIDK